MSDGLDPKYIFAYVFFSVGVLFFVEQFLHLFVAYKLFIKILLLFIIPVFLIGKNRSWELIRNKNRSRRGVAWLLSVSVFLTLLITYVVLARTIDLDGISDALHTQIGLTVAIYPFVAFYVIFINAFVEEFFFRGFLFFHVFRDRFWKYVFNAVLFSVYHIGIFATWFEWYNFVLALVGLFIGSLIFSYVNEKNNSVFNSYLIHAGADLAIILIGVKMLYL